MLVELADVIRPFLESGGGAFPPPYEAYSIEINATGAGVAFEYFRGKDPISVCVGTWSAEFAGEYWSDIESLYYNLTDVYPQLSRAKNPPEAPDAPPWLATLLLPGFFTGVKADSPDLGFLHASEAVLFRAARDLVRF